MDYESRISKLEAQVEMNQKEIERLHEAINELRRLMLERFEHQDARINELRAYFDHKIDRGLKEVRREASINMRWMMGMWLSTMGLIAGLYGRVFGIY
jgi:BMFP domain-containing protein YqiC